MADKNDIVMIHLDRPRMLWFGHKALKTLMAMTGKNLSDFVGDENDIDLEEVEKIAYCGLLSDAKRNNETLRLEDMEDLLDLAPSYGELIDALGRAIAAAFGGIEGAEKNVRRIAAQKK